MAEFCPSQSLWREAKAIVDSPEVQGVFASCAFDELNGDGKVWICAIVNLAMERARNAPADVINLPIMPVKLVNMPRRSEDPRLARGNDNGPDPLGAPRG